MPITQGRTLAIKSPIERGYPFAGRIDGHISPGRVGTVLSRLMPDGYTAHKLRHPFATKGYSGTGSLQASQETLGPRR